MKKIDWCSKAIVLYKAEGEKGSLRGGRWS
jgi:hypothetical protein